MSLTRRHSHAFALALVGASLVACAEATRDRATAPDIQADAYLEVSDSAPPAGGRVVVTIRVSGTRSDHLGSFTGRVAYDTAAITFVAETPLADGVTRISNPQPGEIRVAAIRADGFGTAPIGAFEFKARSASAVGSLALRVDELHDTRMGNAGVNARILPTRVIR